MTKNFNSLKLINILDFGKMENSLQKNLEKLHESMGSKFIIKFNQDLIITCLYCISKDLSKLIKIINHKTGVVIEKSQKEKRSG